MMYRKRADEENALTAPRGKLSRSERNEQVRQRLFEAAARVVAEGGYAEASVTRITEVAGVAQGTFYNHFESRQALLDELLPALGLEMAQFIEDRTYNIRPEVEREIARFRTFFEYLRENPGFHRILNEAEFAAPKGFRRHIDNMAAPYQHMLRRARARGEVADYKDGEIEVIVHILMGACIQMSQRLSGRADETLFEAYARLLRHGLFEK